MSHPVKIEPLGLQRGLDKWRILMLLNIDVMGLKWSIQLIGVGPGRHFGNGRLESKIVNDLR